MNDDAQSALLKTLEEPPAGATLILCADDEDRLLPTVRSRCVIVRLGPVPPRDVERLVVERGWPMPPLAPDWLGSRADGPGWRSRTPPSPRRRRSARSSSGRSSTCSPRPLPNGSPRDADS